MFSMLVRIRFVQVLMSLYVWDLSELQTLLTDNPHRHGFPMALSTSSLLSSQRSGSGFLQLPAWYLYMHGPLECRTV
jgi:hypothetical protein